MTQNERKEPTFGETNTADAKNVAPSLRTTQSPGHTFTPVVKPAGTAKSELPKIEGGEAAQPAGFAFSPVSEKENVETAAEKMKENIEEKIEAVKAKADDVKSVAQDAAKVAMNAAERVIPAAAAAKTTIENTVKEGSSKRRRLGIVALLAAVLGAVFFWLKPSAPETVEELQSQQSGSLPIEFRPVDEAEAQRQEAEAKAQAQAQQEAAAQQQSVQQEQVTQQSQPSQTIETATTNTNTAAQSAQPIANELAQPQTQAQVTEPVVEKPETQGSVVYQPESQQAMKEAVHQPTVQRVERARPQHTSNNQPKVKAVTKAEFEAKKAQNAQLDRLVKNVESGKPAKAAPAPSLAAKTTTTQSAPAAAVASSKTLTVPKGVSLMQVFRDNQLNISDVNAMSKVNNKVSNLKVNEKVTVRLDKNNRVVEMAIGSGGKFIRQADGSYQFK